jgi:hypothetical protein
MSVKRTATSERVPLLADRVPVRNSSISVTTASLGIAHGV